MPYNLKKINIKSAKKILPERVKNRAPVIISALLLSALSLATVSNISLSEASANIEKIEELEEQIDEIITEKEKVAEEKDKIIEEKEKIVEEKQNVEKNLNEVVEIKETVLKEKEEKDVEVVETKKELETVHQEKTALEEENSKLKEEVEQLKKRRAQTAATKNQSSNQSNPSRSTPSVAPSGEKGALIGNFTATAYDLSVDSCGRYPSDRWYGYTASGISNAGKSFEEARTIAVDPKVIPLRSKVYVEFPAPYQHKSGIFTALDTGGAIKGNKIDVFMGDFNSIRTHQSVWAFGRRQVKVYRVN